MPTKPEQSPLLQVLDPDTVRQLRARLEAVRVERTNRMRRAQGRLLQLEEDVARVALLSRALADLCLKKGLFTKRELAEQLVATDVVDGALDFGLDPAFTLPGEERLRGDAQRPRGDAERRRGDAERQRKPAARKKRR